MPSRSRQVRARADKSKFDISRRSFSGTPLARLRMGVATPIESSATVCGFHPQASRWLRQATSDAARRTAVARDKALLLSNRSARTDSSALGSFRNDPAAALRTALEAIERAMTSHSERLFSLVASNSEPSLVTTGRVS